MEFLDTGTEIIVSFLNIHSHPTLLPLLQMFRFDRRNRIPHSIKLFCLYFLKPLALTGVHLQISMPPHFSFRLLDTSLDQNLLSFPNRLLLLFTGHINGIEVDIALGASLITVCRRVLQSNFISIPLLRLQLDKVSSTRFSIGWGTQTFQHVSLKVGQELKAELLLHLNAIHSPFQSVDFLQLIIPQPFTPLHFSSEEGLLLHQNVFRDCLAAGGHLLGKSYARDRCVMLKGEISRRTMLQTLVNVSMLMAIIGGVLRPRLSIRLLLFGG